MLPNNLTDKQWETINKQHDELIKASCKHGIMRCGCSHQSDTKVAYTHVRNVKIMIDALQKEVADILKSLEDY